MQSLRPKSSMRVVRSCHLLADSVIVNASNPPGTDWEKASKGKKG